MLWKHKNKSQDLRGMRFFLAVSRLLNVQHIVVFGKVHVSLLDACSFTAYHPVGSPTNLCAWVTTAGRCPVTSTVFMGPRLTNPEALKSSCRTKVVPSMGESYPRCHYVVFVNFVTAERQERMHLNFFRSDGRGGWGWWCCWIWREECLSQMLTRSTDVGYCNMSMVGGGIDDRKWEDWKALNLKKNAKYYNVANEAI